MASSVPQMAEPYLSIWEDKTGQTDFRDLDDSLFVPATPDRLNAGYSTSVFWLRLDLDNTSEHEWERFLEIELSTISFFDVYARGQSGPILSGGQKRSWNPMQLHRHPVVNVTLPPHSRGSWYIRLENNYSLCIIAWLHSLESLAAKEARESLVFGTYTGVMGFALLVSLYVFFSTRHRTFLHLAIMLLTYHLGFQLTNLGVTWMHLWPESPAWADRATFVMIELSSIAGILFFRSSLEIPRTLPRLDRWLWLPLLKSLVGLGLCTLAFSPGLVSLSVQTTGVLLLFYYGVGIYLWRKAYAPAAYYSIGWLLVILVNILSILQAADLVRFDDPWFRSAVRSELLLLSCALQAGFLAIAIGNQFQKVQKHRESERHARRKLEKSLDDAHIVQEAFIPGDRKASGFEIVTSHHASARIGGDWLGYHHDVKHRRLILAICDVTGHGLPAALLSGAIHGAFHGLARSEEMDALPAPELLNMLMQRLNDVVGMTATNTSLLATMLILSIDLESGRIDYRNAGHTPLVLVRENRPVFILQGGSPLGLKAQPNFGVGHYEARTGDTLFIYTDGLLDNVRASRRLQIHHLTRFLSSEDSLDAIQKRIEEVAGPDAAAMEDDCSYIICRLHELAGQPLRAAHRLCSIPSDRWNTLFRRLSMRTILTFILGLALAGNAAAADVCFFLQGSSLRSEADRFAFDLTPDARTTLREQHYPQGFVGSFLKQACAIGEPLSSQLAFVITSLMSAAAADETLAIEAILHQNVATVWVQGVERTLTLPTSSLRTAGPVHDDFVTIDATLPDVIGAAYFSVAKLSEKGQVFGLLRIMKAASRFESGILYRLALELRVGDATEVHDVLVRAQPWTRSWELLADTVRN
jgi:serine phosphatase RsbU (regulator of sigma subunit)